MKTIFIALLIALCAITGVESLGSWLFAQPSHFDARIPFDVGKLTLTGDDIETMLNEADRTVTEKWAFEDTVDMRAAKVNAIKTSAKYARPLVTFVFDDAYATDYTVMFPVFEAQGEVAVSAVVTKSIGTSGMTWAQIGGLVTGGWEIASHTHNHIYCAESSEVVQRREWETSIDTLAAHGITVKNAQFPFNNHDVLAREIASEYFRSVGGISSAGKKRNSHLLNTYALARQGMDDHTQLAAYQASVDTCEMDSVWLIFALHETNSDDATAMNTLIDYIQAKNIDIVTLDGGLDVFENVLISDLAAISKFGGRLQLLETDTIRTFSPLPLVIAAGLTKIGTAKLSSGHGLGIAGANGDLQVTGLAEFEDKTWFDSDVWFGFRTAYLNDARMRFGTGYNNWLMWSTVQATPAQLWCLANGSQSIIFTTTANEAKDHDHGTSADPTIFIHSATNPDNDNTQWVSICHDKVDAVINVGTGGIKLNSISVSIDSVKISGTDLLFYANGGATPYKALQ